MQHSEPVPAVARKSERSMLTAHSTAAAAASSLPVPSFSASNPSLQPARSAPLPVASAAASVPVSPAGSGKPKAGKPKHLIQSVPTRWNSTLYMLERAYLLRAAIIKAASEYATGSAGTSEDRRKIFDTLQEFKVQLHYLPCIIAVLANINQATQMMQGDHGMLSEVMRLVDRLELQLQVRPVDSLSLITNCDSTYVSHTSTGTANNNFSWILDLLHIG